MMLKFVVLILLPVCVVFACSDGYDNVIRVWDDTSGKGAIVFHDLEILTYNARGYPTCSGGVGVFNIPGYFKLDGKVEVPKGLQAKTFRLMLTAEKDSWLVGSICKRGKSVHSFVSDSICNYNLRELGGDVFDELLANFTSPMPPTDLKQFIRKDKIPVGKAPGKLDGSWKFRVEIYGDSQLVSEVYHSGWVTIKLGHGEL